jgi:hypothetical protein
VYVASKPVSTGIPSMLVLVGISVLGVVPIGVGATVAVADVVKGVGASVLTSVPEGIAVAPEAEGSTVLLEVEVLDIVGAAVVRAAVVGGAVPVGLLVGRFI